MRRARAIRAAAAAAWIAAAAGVAAAEPARARPNLDVPADHSSFEALRRLQTRTGRLLPRQSFPQAAAPILGTFAGSARPGSHDEATLSRWFPGARRERVAWTDSATGHSLFLTPLVESGLGSRHTADSAADRRALGGVGLLAYGTVTPWLTYYTRGLAYTEWTNRAQFGHQFGPDQGETYTVEKGAGDSLLPDRSYHRFENYVVADLPKVRLKLGRDRIHPGPGYFSDLMARRDTPPYFLFEGRVDFAPWLTLDAHLLRMTDTDHGIRKYANLHRFEFRPHPSLALAFKDIVIYQDRDPDPVYLLPLAPLTFVEASNGGRDNAAMGIDFLYAAFPGLSTWGEIFVDDLLGPSAFFDDFWENRWAALAGFQVAAPWPSLDADLVVEYSHVEPWTYNGRQAQTSFRHFDVPSASKLGPDSRSLDLRIAWRPRADLEWKSRWERDEKGTGRQSTLGTIHDDALDGQGKEFLQDARTRYALGHELAYRFRSHLSATLGWSRTWNRGTGDAYHLRCHLLL